MDDGPIVSIEDEDEPGTSPMARKYFDAGLAALDQGDIKEARRWLKLAHTSAPDNADFQAAWERVEREGKEAIEAWRASRRPHKVAEGEGETRSKQAAPAGRAAPARSISLPVAAVATLGMAAAVGLMLSRPAPEALLDHAATYAQVAAFRSLVVAPQGGWVGVLHEDWSELEEPDKLAHCEEIAAQLPPSGSGVMVISTADGGSTVCKQVSAFPPGPEPEAPAAPAAPAASPTRPPDTTPPASAEAAEQEPPVPEPPSSD